ncbi:hypothetical protein OGAPHI_000475 [Ogataea philodendri]|uniref:Uncharacterized protein n=1 Tax=Ogataea philodendri TaxID=1378263 RepID=A0A9P8PFT3_9ASCO|nr:uncharacterized protein OGAPHI_000475 [Ogataea philodendri]KAH3671252.1 hypothetical protein OGAPHI_000475 [Ogataea philodendri]
MAVTHDRRTAGLEQTFQGIELVRVGARKVEFCVVGELVLHFGEQIALQLGVERVDQHVCSCQSAVDGLLHERRAHHAGIFGDKFLRWNRASLSLNTSNEVLLANGTFCWINFSPDQDVGRITFSFLELPIVSRWDQIPAEANELPASASLKTANDLEDGLEEAVRVVPSPPPDGLFRAPRPWRFCGPAADCCLRILKFSNERVNLPIGRACESSPIWYNSSAFLKSPSSSIKLA